MTAVSQTYPNYLGGLNEQPDELKKPGQLVEAKNVIPDPTIGLTRRPGFELLQFHPYSSDQPNDDARLVPGGTWFEIELPNTENDDYIYFGYVNNDGEVTVFNQDGQLQLVKYTDISITPHKEYEYNGNILKVTDSDANTVEEIPVSDFGEDSKNTYFKHEPLKPLKYCISKNHIIITNPKQEVSIGGQKVVSDLDSNRYYSYLNLKVLDTQNYNYTFKRWYADENIQTYTAITNIDITSVEDLGDRYDSDTSLPLHERSFTFTLDAAPGVTEQAIVEVTFRGNVEQLKSSDGDGFRNEARYTYTAKILNPGKGYKTNQVFKETLSAQTVGSPDKPDLTITFKISDTEKYTATKHDNIVPFPDVDDSITDKTAAEILLKLQSEFRDAGIDKVIVVGNGLYLENQAPFSISTDEIAVADVMNSQKLPEDDVPIVRVSTVAELPLECYAGFIVEVSNSLNGDNNYYLKYKSESLSSTDDQAEDLNLTKSDGFWEEIAKPFEAYTPQDGTLPHMITVAKEADQPNYTFILSPISYKARTAGTVRDNPSMFQDQARITEVNYYKNRLFFFTNVGTIITTRAGEIDNLFLDTAITVSAVDPIDLIANSNQRVAIHSSAVVNNGLVLFGDSEQYSITTSNDLLTSETASVTKIANYTCDPLSEPVYVGTNLGFVSSGVTRFYEMTNVYDRGPVDINERSQQIQTRFGSGFNMPVSSREQSMVAFYKRYTADSVSSDDILIYRFRQESSQESSQTAWVSWDVDDKVTYVSLPRDKMFVMVKVPNPNPLGEDTMKLYRMQGDTIDGLPATGLVRPPVYRDGWTDRDDPETGVPFETSITFPTMYPMKGDKADITANTVIHRAKLSTSAMGAYNLIVQRDGYDDYFILVEQTPSDEYRANFPNLRKEHVEVVPIYTRNTATSLTIKSEFNAPFTLNSLTWEGDWNPPYYKRA